MYNYDQDRIEELERQLKGLPPKKEVMVEGPLMNAKQVVEYMRPFLQRIRSSVE